MSLTVEPKLPAPAEPAELRPEQPVRPRGAWWRAGGQKNLMAVVFALWLMSGVYLVGPDQQGVETRFGAVTDQRVMPGIHFHWPYPIGAVHKLKVLQLQRGVIGGDPADEVLGRVEPLQSQFLTGDQNIINVRSVVQYSVATPVEYLFRARGVSEAVEAAVEAELGRQIASRAVDDVLTTEKVAIQETVRQRAQELIDGYGLGTVISTVNIERISPPAEAADAFRDVASARADAARIVNEAEGYANDIVPRARGEAQQTIQAAFAYRQRKINEALGDTVRFARLAEEHAKNPEVTRSRLYLEAMEGVLPRLKKTIVDAQSDVDLTIIRRRSPSKANGRSTPATPSSASRP